MKIYFDDEKLDVYRNAIAFYGWVGKFIDYEHEQEHE
jgi:hypothetical protein